MRKIPTVFRRDPDDMRRLLPEPHPDAAWVLDGVGYPTRKYDGTCVLVDNAGTWYARREVKPGKDAPAGFIEVDHDPVTGKRVGWEPAEQSGYAKTLREAIDASEAEAPDSAGYAWEAGTYELCGPKVNRNPEGYDRHTLVRHGAAERPIGSDLTFLPEGQPRTAESIRDAVLTLAEVAGWEGIVFHGGPEGAMAKIKARDYA